MSLLSGQNVVCQSTPVRGALTGNASDVFNLLTVAGEVCGTLSC